MLDTPKFCRETRENHALSLLLCNDLNLIDFLLTSDREHLTGSPEELIQVSKAFSRGQQVLIQVSLDIWSGEGRASINDVLWFLDNIRFENFMLAMEFLRYGQKS